MIVIAPACIVLSQSVPFKERARESMQKTYDDGNEPKDPAPAFGL